EDALFVLGDIIFPRRLHIELTRPLVIGDAVRDWTLASESAVWLYDHDFQLLALKSLPNTFRYFWPFRAAISHRKRFGTPMIERGLTWYEYQELYASKLRTPFSIVFAFVATHNHFVLDRGGKVFNRSAPVIKLPSHATEEDHLALLGLLNSSTACFWMKQVFHNKGSTVDEKGARQTTIAFENFYEFTGTGLQKLPVTSEKPIDLAVSLDHLAQEWHKQLPSQLAERLPLPRTLLDAQKDKAASLLGSMIALQEELDWRCYELYGITDEDLCYRDGAGQQLKPPAIALGQRAFEIVMARKMAVGELETTWFERHSSTPITEMPAEWPED